MAEKKKLTDKYYRVKLQEEEVAKRRNATKLKEKQHSRFNRKQQQQKWQKQQPKEVKKKTPFIQAKRENPFCTL